MSTKSTIYVVIPVHNRQHYTKECLKMLAKQTHPHLRTVVVDDGSTDGTREMIMNDFSEVMLCSGNGNLYWNGSIRLGVEKVLQVCRNSDYVLVLNDDLAFNNRFVQDLFESARLHPNALVHASNSFLDSPEIIEFGGVKRNWWTAKSCVINRGRNRNDFPSGHCEKSDLLWGRGLMVPVKVFQDIGNYDSRIVHRGDPELPRRAAKAGYDLLVAYDVVAYMYREQSPNNVKEQEVYSIRQFKEYFTSIHSCAHMQTLFVISFAMTVSRLQGLSYFFFSILRHLWHFFSRVRHF